MLAKMAALGRGVAYFAGAMVNVRVGFKLAVAASAKIPEADAAHFLVISFKAGVANDFVTVYFLGGSLGTLLIGIALWRSRTVPRCCRCCSSSGTSRRSPRRASSFKPSLSSLASTAARRPRVSLSRGDALADVHSVESVADFLCEPVRVAGLEGVRKEELW
jgi:hypothetical protein